MHGVGRERRVVGLGQHPDVCRYLRCPCGRRVLLDDDLLQPRGDFPMTATRTLTLALLSFAGMVLAGVLMALFAPQINPADGFVLWPLVRRSWA